VNPADDRIKELQQQLSEVNTDLRIEDAAEKDDKLRTAHITSAVVVVLILMLTALFLFKTLSPTGYSVVNESQTPASDLLVSEQQVAEESAIEEITVPAEEVEVENLTNETAQETVNETMNETGIEILPNEIISNESFATNDTLNVSLNETLQNETIFNGSFANETLNVSEAEANATLNESVVLNETLNETVLEILPNETISNESFANETGNVSIPGENVTTEINQTAEANVTPEIAGEYLPEELEQGNARVGVPVGWTKRIMVNWTGGAVVTTYLPKEAENISVYEAESESPGQQLTGFQIWKEWRARRDITRNELSRSKYAIYHPILRAHEVGESYETTEPESTGQATEESQTPAMIGFSIVGAETGNGIVMRFLNWLDSLIGIGSPTGAAVVEEDRVQLARPKDNSLTGRNINFLYRVTKDYDSCSLYFDGIKVKTDELVIGGLNFFTLKRLDKGAHVWNVVCIDRSIDTRSETWRLIVEEPVENETAPEITLPIPSNESFNESGNVFYYETETGDAIIVNITDTVAEAPKVYEINYNTPAPEATEKVFSQYVKTVTVASNISYQNITAYTALPGVPAWMVKLNWQQENEYVAVPDANLIDKNSDGLIDGVEWTVPHLSEQTYEVNLTYEITQVNVTNADKRDSNHTYEEDATQLVAYQDGLFIPVNKKLLHIELDSPLEQNDTLSVYAWANKDVALELRSENSTEVLSTLTLKKGEWNLYNLTISTPISASSTFDLYSDDNVKYDYVTAYDKRAIIPKKIVPPGNNLTLVLTQNETIDVTQTPQFEPAEVTLKQETGLPVAEFNVYFENAEMDIDLSGLVAVQDPVEMKAVIHMDSWPSAIAAEKTLYIPSSGKGAVYICPNATSIAEVNEACQNKVELVMGTTTITTTLDDNTTTNQTITVSEVNANGTMLYKVSGLTGTGGGESITILNLHSYPSVGGNWTVMFNTTGTANLTITGINETTFTEFLFDDSNTTDDLEFMELMCGNVSLKDRIMLIDANGTFYNYSNLTLNDSIVVDSLFVENYSCSGTAYLTNTEKYGGSHWLLFQFGGANATAENYASQLSCYLDTAGSNCDAGYTTIFHMSSIFNAHAELANQSSYNNYVCCMETYGETLGTNCSDSKAKTVLKLSGQTDAHVEKSTQSNYLYSVCLSPTSNYNITCTYRDGNCVGNEACVAAISSVNISSDTNLQVSNCTGSEAYGTKVCCGTQDNTPAQGGCVVPYENYNVTQNVQRS